MVLFLYNGVGRNCIDLSPENEYETGKVVLIYHDKANSEKVRNAAMDDL